MALVAAGSDQDGGFGKLVRIFTLSDTPEQKPSERPTPAFYTVQGLDRNRSVQCGGSDCGLRASMGGGLKIEL